jgi:hypothetical protein
MSHTPHKITYTVYAFGGIQNTAFENLIVIIWARGPGGGSLAKQANFKIPIKVSIVHHHSNYDLT